MKRVLVTVAPDGDVHVLGSVLRGARSQTVGTQREIVVTALIVVVFSTRVQLAEDELPVEALLRGIPVQRAPATVVFDLDGPIGESSEDDEIAVTLASLVHRVGKNLKGRMSAAVKTVRAEYDGGAQTNALLVLQLTNAVVAVIGRGVCHVRSFDGSVQRAATPPSRGKRRSAALYSPAAKTPRNRRLSSTRTRWPERAKIDFTTCRASSKQHHEKHQTYVRVSPASPETRGKKGAPRRNTTAERLSNPTSGQTR